MATDPNAPGAPAAAQPSPRYHDLDALRAAAMLLGIVLHAALFLVPDAWGVLDKKASDALPYEDVVSAIHGFRMPVFFLMSGFFTAMLWQRRGLAGMLRQRLLRVGLPLLAGCFTIIPLSAWVWVVTTDYDLAKDFPAGASGVEMVIGVWLFAWLDDFHHLWFLWHLLWLVGLFALLARLGLTFTHRWAWWTLVPLVALPQFFMLWIGADTSTGLIIAPHVLAYYAIFFLFGAFLHQRGVSVPKRWAMAAPIALAVLYPLAVFVLRVAVKEYDARNEELAAAIWLGGTVVQVAFTWLMCFGLMGLFRWAMAVERPWVRYVSDSSYWLYLWHLP
ncbi:MAG: acyltransferase family protein, partial [Chloroflexota bacterium]|nr:acyltransferase family protein [Chloroflexota bacterium]